MTKREIATAQSQGVGVGLIQGTEPVIPTEDIAALSPEQISKMLHELYAQQVDLQMQNAALRKSQTETENRIAQIMDNMIEGCQIIGFDWRYIYLNETAARQGRQSLDTFLGHTMMEVVPGIQSTELFTVLRRVMVNRTTECMVHEIIYSGADKGWFELRVQPVEEGIFILSIDITERKKGEQALEVQKVFLRQVVDMVPEIICVKNIDGSFALANKTLAAAYGTTVDQLEGHTDNEFNQSKEEIESFRENDLRVIRDRKPMFVPEEKITFADGSVHWLTTTKIPLIDQDGSCTRLLAVAMDITNRKKNESALHNVQRLQSLGVLAGGIAHDFNNLMGGIYGYIDMAGEKNTDSKISLYLSKAMNTIDRAKGLTAQLLTFAKGGAPVRKITQLPVFIKETVQFALSGSNVIGQYDVAEDLYPCNIDAGQIGQVVDNIVINAKQAMPLGGIIEIIVRNVHIEQAAHPLLPTGDFVKISIADCGIGISAELLPRIFDPFFTTKSTGHGLGLATCYSIINRHGGCIEVESEPGKGSVFHILLPAAVGAMVENSENAARQHTGTGTFIVMDDEEIIRETINDMLETHGYSAVCVNTGTEAVDTFVKEVEAGRRVLGFILDLTIPGGMGGAECITEIRKHSTTIPAFVASGYSEDPVMKNPAEYGFTASICKPFRKDELAKMLQKHL